MALREGYKESEVGLIPVDWNCLHMGEIGESLIGLTYSPSDVDEYGVLVLRSSNVQGNQLAYKNNVFVDMELPKRVMVKEGDILICVRNGSRQLIGKCALIDSTAKGAAFGAFMSIYRSESSNIIFYQFQSNVIKKQIEEVMGATINQITNKDLASFRVPLPPTKAEQTAIANALSDVDSLIKSLSTLISKKYRIKQGAMQTLLNPYDEDRQLKDGWVEKKLVEVGFFSKGSGVRKDEAQSGSLPCIRYGEIYTKHSDYIKQFYSFISQEVAKTSKRLQLGDLLFTGSGETKEDIGKCVAFVFDFAAYAGGDIVILSIRTGDALFYGYYLNTHSINKQKASKGQGDAVVHISATSLGNIDIIVPEKILEQTRIATILSDMDTEITALETKLIKYQNIKQGMMQSLLTGRIRLI